MASRQSKPHSEGLSGKLICESADPGFTHDAITGNHGFIMGWSWVDHGLGWTRGWSRSWVRHGFGTGLSRVRHGLSGPDHGSSWVNHGFDTGSSRVKVPNTPLLLIFLVKLL